MEALLTQLARLIVDQLYTQVDKRKKDGDTIEADAPVDQLYMLK